jgi:hypothetical protein
VSKNLTEQKLRDWGAKSMQLEDYAFAVSTKRGQWESPSHIWHRRLVDECLAWEIEREFSACRKPPFIKANKKRIAELEQYCNPTPRSLPPLNEVMDLAKAIELIQQQPNFPVSTFHVFEIEHYEDAENTIQRFRNWLIGKSMVGVRYKIVSRDIALDKTKMALDKPRVRKFVTANGATVSIEQGQPGRKDYNRALLRAIAVRRLKQAGYTRRETAERFFTMNEAILGRDQWKDFPKIAGAAISEQHRKNLLFERFKQERA